MPEIDPYAPPRESPGPVRRRKKRRGRVDFVPQRRNILAVLALWLLTCGIYAQVWMIMRRDFLDSLQSQRKLGVAPWIILVLWFVPVAVAVAMPDAPTFSQAINVGVAAAYLALVFRVVGMLRDHFHTNRMGVKVSGVAAFFLNVLYLQMVLNNAAEAQLADEHAREERRRERRRAKKSDR